MKLRRSIIISIALFGAIVSVVLNKQTVNRATKIELETLVPFVIRATNRDVAVINLQCAIGLSRRDEFHIEQCLRSIDQWTDRVKAETQRHLYRFRARPAEFENSEGYFRMLMLSVVLYEDFGIRYNARLISNPDQLETNDRFFANSYDVFLTGLLGTNRTGTCSSMPVLYVAIGRRLGYPLKLVTTKAHLFVRWEGAGERFNVEATSKGLNRYDDEHYKQWPFPVTEEEIRSDGYLKSLTPNEEFALFLSIRGHCLKEAGRFSEAAESFSEAARLAPAFRGYRLLHQNALQLTQLAGKTSL
jgi:hypothetical protein